MTTATYGWCRGPPAWLNGDVHPGAELESLVRERVRQDQVKIPPYPAVALRLQRMVEDGNFGIADLARVALSDGVLTATLLRIANSAYYRATTPVTTVGEAIGRLGAQELCRVALAASLGADANAHGPLAELRRSAWRQSLACGLLCQTMAPHRGLDAQHAFLAGILHDFGRVVAIASLEDLVARGPSDLVLAEEDWEHIVEALHLELGTVIAARWNLPELLATVIEHHHAPEQAGIYAPVAELVAFCDNVVALSEDCPYLLEHELAAVPGVEGPDEIEALMRFIPAIPVYISALDDVAAASGTPVRSRVRKREDLLGGPSATLDLPVAWTRSNGETPYRALYATPKGIAIEGRAPMFEGNIVRLRIDAGAPVEVSGRVVRCASERGVHRIEIRLFALPGRSHAWWDEIVQRIRTSPTA